MIFQLNLHLRGIFDWLLFNFLPPCRAPRSSWWTLHLAMCSQLRGAPERGSQGAAGKMVRGNNHGLHGSYMEKKYAYICVENCGNISKICWFIYIYTYVTQLYMEYPHCTWLLHGFGTTALASMLWDMPWPSTKHHFWSTSKHRYIYIY